jgi:putative NADPH-quinone reductase
MITVLVANLLCQYDELNIESEVLSIMETIIYAHPWSGSFNNAELKAITTKLAAAKTAYQIIDLYHDGFQPAYTAEELKNFSHGVALDPLVKQYQAQLRTSSKLTFIFPIWWSNAPAIIKGFIDKVMLPGFAYHEDTNWHGHLTWIQQVAIFTTSEVSQSQLENNYGNPIQNWLINTLLRDLGIPAQQVTWSHFGEINSSTPAQRQAYLEQLTTR